MAIRGGLDWPIHLLRNGNTLPYLRLGAWAVALGVAATCVACDDSDDAGAQTTDVTDSDDATEQTDSALVEPEPTNVAEPTPAPDTDSPVTQTDVAPEGQPSVTDASGGDESVEGDAAAGMADAATALPVADAGNEGGLDASGELPCPEVPEFVEPTALSETGLYADIATGELGEGVYEYAPQYALWTDGAIKRRFVRLPPCTQIDTSDMDFWTYPPGTKLWKQFSRENEAGEMVRVETRLIQKYTQTKWFMTAFIWNEEQTDALADPADDEDTYVLRENAMGTEHDVPGRAACNVCHGGMWDKVLGFSALQLSHEAEPGWMTLDELVARDLVTAAPSAPLSVPGTAGQADALGYLHANCGHCHNPNSKQANLGMEFWLRAETLTSNEETNTFATNVGLDTQSSQKPVEEPPLRVVPGEPEQSAIYWRMVQPPVFPQMPEGGVHMPLIGTEIIDELGVQLVEDWILSIQ